MIYVQDCLLQSFKKIKRSDHLAVSEAEMPAITQVEVKGFGGKSRKTVQKFVFESNFLEDL